MTSLLVLSTARVVDAAANVASLGGNGPPAGSQRSGPLKLG